MGLNQESDKAVFLGINKGLITRRLKEGEGDTSAKHYRTRQVEEDGGSSRTIHEYTFKSITGTLLKCTFKPPKEGTKFKENLELLLEDDGVKYCLQMGSESGYASAFMKAIQSVTNLALPITITPKADRQANGNWKTSLFITPDGDTSAVKWFYTKDNPNGLPPPTAARIRGEEVWDYYDQSQFLKAMITNELNPKLEYLHNGKSANPAKETHDPFDPNNEPGSGINDGTDDLPF